MTRPISNVPLDLFEVVVDDVRLVARPGMRFPVRQLDGQLVVSVPELGLHVVASDRCQLSDSLELAVADAWRDTVQKEFDEQSSGCSAQRRGCLERWFREY